jgi:hypothetical protein
VNPWGVGSLPLVPWGGLLDHGDYVEIRLRSEHPLRTHPSGFIQMQILGPDP